MRQDCVITRISRVIANGWKESEMCRRTGRRVRRQVGASDRRETRANKGRENGKRKGKETGGATAGRKSVKAE